ADGRATVLVVDDDPTTISLLGKMLEKEGYRVISASNGVEALSLARQHRPQAITLDVLMPQMDGWRALKELKADVALRDIPVIMVTGPNARGMATPWGAAAPPQAGRPAAPDGAPARALSSFGRRLDPGGRRRPPDPRDALPDADGYGKCGPRRGEWAQRFGLARQPSGPEPNLARPVDAGDGRLRVSARAADAACLRGHPGHRGDREGAERGGFRRPKRTGRTDHC